MRKSRRSFDDEHEEHIDETWLIPYADLLTLLLALFIVLFAASSINKSKYETIMASFKSELTGTKIEDNRKGLNPTPSSQKVQKLMPPQTQPNKSPKIVQNPADAEFNQLKQKLQAVVTLQESKRGIEVTLKEVILFDSGKADLKERSFQTLDGLVGLINTVSNPISIEGHTDNVPIISSTYPSNWELSSARAASVLHYFQTKNIAPSRMQFTGYGEYKPLFPNDNDVHRQANRRVTIVILRNS
jgi:chemotaxis protein MotB